MQIILETERLFLREFTTEDTDFVIHLVNTPGWLAYVGDRNIKTKTEAETYLLKGPIESYAKNGFGLCLVALKGTQTAIGMCGIIRRNDLDTPDIGFAFLPEYMGKGYAYESAKATLQHAHDVLKLPKISAITVAENNKSIRLIEKLGLRFEKRFYIPTDREELMLFGTNTED